MILTLASSPGANFNINETSVDMRPFGTLQ